MPPLSKESRGRFFTPASAGPAFVFRWLCPGGLESTRRVAGAMRAGTAWATAAWKGGHWSWSESTGLDI